MKQRINDPRFSKDDDKHPSRMDPSVTIPNPPPPASLIEQILVFIYLYIFPLFLIYILYHFRKYYKTHNIIYIIACIVILLYILFHLFVMRMLEM